MLIQIENPCLCGCNQMVPMYDNRNRRRYFIRGHREHKTGLKHWNWKGGRHIDIDGYVNVYSPGHPRARKNMVYEHILIMEKHIGRQIKRNEIVHHKNHIKSDNRIENLEIVNPTKHQNIHARERRKKHTQKCKYCNSNQLTKDGTSIRKIGRAQHWTCHSCNRQFTTRLVMGFIKG